MAGQDPAIPFLHAPSVLGAEGKLNAAVQHRPIGGGEPVTWTKPEDFVYDPKQQLSKLALPGSNGINVCMADGSVRFIDLSRVSEKTLKAAITANGGEVMGPDWDDLGGGGAGAGDAVPRAVPLPKTAPEPKGGLPPKAKSGAPQGAKGGAPVAPPPEKKP